jgi:hypothetical protein
MLAITRPTADSASTYVNIDTYRTKARAAGLVIVSGPLARSSEAAVRPAPRLSPEPRW